MSRATAAIFENEEGMLGRPIMIQGEPEFLLLKVYKGPSISEMANIDPTAQDFFRTITFRRTEECVPVGDCLAVVYRQVVVDKDNY